MGNGGGFFMTQELDYISNEKKPNALSNLEEKNWVHFRLKPGEEIFICKKCLTLSTRPRAQYDEEGVCNACRWSEHKKTEIDWKERWEQVEQLCNEHRNEDGTKWDVLVPCSGGKDGSYVAWMLKNKLDMHPLCITMKPQLQTEIGRKNLENFVESGFDHILLTPNPRIYQRLAKRGLIEQGRPKLPFVIGISLLIIKFAMKFNIPFIMYGEEGEEEYGGATSQIGRYRITRDYLINYYYSGHPPSEYLDEFTQDELKWWEMPSEEEFDKAKLFLTHWSHYEDWDPYKHYLTAKNHCGFQELPTRSIGTYTNFAQLDDDLQDLHAYLMFIKFGFGRCWSDACIDIRRGAMDRKQAIALVKAYDGEFPEQLLPKFLDYFEMTEEEFFNTIDSFRSPDIWEKVDGEWKLKFDIDEISKDINVSTI
jgi:N-acetyl sugar amidotransferase